MARGDPIDCLPRTISIDDDSNLERYRFYTVMQTTSTMISRRQTILGLCNLPLHKLDTMDTQATYAGSLSTSYMYVQWTSAGSLSTNHVR